MTTPTATPSADDPYPWLARGAIPPYQPPFPEQPVCPDATPLAWDKDGNVVMWMRKLDASN